MNWLGSWYINLKHGFIHRHWRQVLWNNEGKLWLVLLQLWLIATILVTPRPQGLLISSLSNGKSMFSTHESSSCHQTETENSPFNSHDNYYYYRYLYLCQRLCFQLLINIISINLFCNCEIFFLIPYYLRTLKTEAQKTHVNLCIKDAVEQN